MTETRSKDCDSHPQEPGGDAAFSSTSNQNARRAMWPGWIRDGRHGKCESQLPFSVSGVDRWFKSSADLG